MTFITGDTHGEFSRLVKLCNRIQITEGQDSIIILGDSGINYYTDLRAKKFKNELAKLPLNIFCIHGNHEERAENIPTYKKRKFWGGDVLVEDEFPNIKFALDGHYYKIPTELGIKEAIVIGGAYSVDKYYRLQNGLNWYESEQPTPVIKQRVERNLKRHNWTADFVLTHTCPSRYIPREWFISGIDQSKVDTSTEQWLDIILDDMEYFEKWYCGHYHGSKKIDKMQFMFQDIDLLM